MSAIRPLGRRGALSLAALPMLLANPVAAAPAPGKILIVASLQATYSIARALSKDTAIEVRPAFPADVSMDQQASYLAKRRRADFIASAKVADAAITIRRIWDIDPLFSAVRAQNIRVIEIDASTPFAPEMAGVALLETSKPAGSGDGRVKSISPYIWLSLTNAVRMTDIIAADFRRLSEADAATIDRNQQQFRRSILEVRAQFESKLAEVDNPAVILLGSELGYIASDLGLQITASFSKSDFDWTDADVKALTDKMAATGTRTIVASHQPKPPIAAAIAGAGGRLAVIELADPGIANQDGQLDPDGFLAISRANLAQLITALSA